jgi:hypothetical protein
MKHRTALIVAASLAAVVFAAAIAVAVNLGILTVADSSPVGQLTTATVARDASAPVAQYQSQTPAPAAAAKPQRQTQKYVIKKAGTVQIAFSDKAVRFVSASAERHWSWKLAQSVNGKLTVTFTHGSDTYTFVAQVGKNGKVTAKVDHPVTKVLPSSGGGTTWTAAPAPAPATTHSAAGEPGEGGQNGGQADD